MCAAIIIAVMVKDRRLFAAVSEYNEGYGSGRRETKTGEMGRAREASVSNNDDDYWQRCLVLYDITYAIHTDRYKSIHLTTDSMCMLLPDSRAKRRVKSAETRLDNWGPLNLFKLQAKRATASSRI